LERAVGIEPASSVWKTEIITIIRCPLVAPTVSVGVPLSQKSVLAPAKALVGLRSLFLGTLLVLILSVLILTFLGQKINPFNAIIVT